MGPLCDILIHQRDVLLHRAHIYKVDKYHSTYWAKESHRDGTVKHLERLDPYYKTLSPLFKEDRLKEI